MRPRGPILDPDRAATLAISAVLILGTAVFAAVDPSVAAVWLGSTVVMSRGCFGGARA